MKILLVSIIASAISFMPTYAAADIKVSDKDGVFLGYLVGDGEITDRSSIRLYFPDFKRIATYINISGAFSYEIRTTPLLFTSSNCTGDPYISYFATPFDEIFKHTTLGLTYVGSGDIVFINFNSIISGLLCQSSNIQSYARKAEPIPTGTVPLTLGIDRLPLRLEQVNNVVVVPYQSR